MQKPDKSNQAAAVAAEGRQLVARLGGTWHSGGGMCRCPAHDDRSPSLSVRVGDRRLLFHCFAGCDTREVIRALNLRRPPGNGPAAHGDGALPGPADPHRGHREAAARLWGASRPLARSPAAAYLYGRGLSVAAPDLRYHPRTPLGRGRAAIFRPALLAAVRDETGFVAVHRTFLDPCSSGLADMPRPKRALGRLGRGAVRLRPPADLVLGWAEGVENAIAASLLTGIPCWATLGNERFAKVALPPCVTRLILFLDNDAGGRRAEALARAAWRGKAVEIEARYPRGAGDDWNDLLLRRATPMS